MSESQFLRACQGLPTDRVPLWIMRQAGRYLPAYQEVRARHDFLTMCHTAELAAEVTLQPVREFGFDAAIIFSDILIPFEPMGISVEFHEGKGPRLTPQIRTREDIDRLKDPDFETTTAFLRDALGIVRRELPPDTALIGFAGAPWTMACYGVEGMGSRDYATVKQMMNTDPSAFHELMGKLTTALIRYLKMQLDAGADAVQLFDSWADALSPHGLPRLLAALRAAHLRGTARMRQAAHPVQQGRRRVHPPKRRRARRRARRGLARGPGRRARTARGPRAKGVAGQS